MSWRISSGTFGRPPRHLDLQHQYNRKPARCQRTMVSGFTIANASQMFRKNRWRPTNTKRSKTLNETLLGAVRRRTFICCRNVQISASRAARDRNRSTTAQPINLKRSLIHDSTARFSVKRQPDQVSDKDSMKIIHVDRDVLILRNDVLQFEQMQLQLAATQIPGS